jgi:Leucine-rich repeat (LRR) protein
MKHRLLQFLFLAIALSCGREVSELKIIDGQSPALDVRSSTVSLVDSATSLSFCSGTLLAKNLVLTAAHCITDKTMDSIAIRLSNGETFALEKLAPFKSEQKFGVNFDVAWLMLERAVPEGFEPVELLRDPSALVGQDVRIAGYGQRASVCKPEDEDCGTGVLFEAKSRVSEFLNSGRWHNLILIRSDDRQGPCLGDSGGPLFATLGSKTFVAGNFVGWDKRLVPEVASKICDKGEAIYNAAGLFVDWIEKSSGVKLLYSADLNPLPKAREDAFSGKTPTSFIEWCQYRNHQDPAWYTTQRLISLAGDYALDNAGDIRANFDDCNAAAENLKAKIKADRGLDLDAYAPTSFGENAVITDLRPLASLGDFGIDRITLTGHRIEDFSPLEKLRRLKKIEIINNKGSIFGPFDAGEFSSIETLTSRASAGSLRIDNLPKIKSLRFLEITGDSIPAEMVWDTSPVRSIKFENVTASDTLNLTMPKLQNLFVKAPVSIALPSLLPELQTLHLEDLSAYGMPRSLPKLRNMTVIRSQQIQRLSGAVRFENLGLLETLEMRDNQGIEDFALPPKLAKLRTVILSGNHFRSIDSFQSLPKLTLIDISRNQLEVLPYFEDLPQLDELDASSNLITGDLGLDHIDTITSLKLSDNPLSCLEGISRLPKLTKLDLEDIGNGSLDNLDGLSAMENLEQLRVGRNSFRSVKEFLRFPKLQVLVLSDNQIQDVSKLKALEDLGYLELVNNPLAARVCPLKNVKFCRFEWASANN